MEYVLVVRANFSDTKTITKYVWEDVQEHLRHQLSNLTTSVEIIKYSVDGKTLGRKYVTMGDLYEVCVSPKDDILKR